jgi:hypothetical protein
MSVTRLRLFDGKIFQGVDLGDDPHRLRINFPFRWFRFSLQT